MNFPKDVIALIGLELDYSDIISMEEVFPKVFNDSFWLNKLNRDFLETEDILKITNVKLCPFRSLLFNEYLLTDKYRVLYESINKTIDRKIKQGFKIPDKKLFLKNSINR